MDLHTNCRKVDYDKDVKRSVVPDEKVPWSVKWEDYKPTTFMKLNFGGDPPAEFMKKGFHDIIFNAKEESGWNRLSYLGPYNVEPGIGPLNPRGRTGLAYCGHLQLWGPNHAGCSIVTRWARVDDRKGLPYIVESKDDVKESAKENIAENLHDVKEEENESKKDTAVEAWELKLPEKVKKLPSSVMGTWKSDAAYTYTICLNRKARLKKDADASPFLAHGERKRVWAQVWFGDRTKVRLVDVTSRNEYTGELKMDENKVQIFWSDDDVWTMIYEEFDLDNEDGSMERQPGEILTRDGKPVLEVAMFQGFSDGNWAIPWWFVKRGDDVKVAPKSEIDWVAAVYEQQEEMKEHVTEFFDNGGVEIYRGYVDDSRNTDNSWVEAIAMNFHDETGEIVEALDLESSGLTWYRLYGDRLVEPTHLHFLEIIAKKRGAYF